MSHSRTSSVRAVEIANVVTKATAVQAKPIFIGNSRAEVRLWSGYSVTSSALLLLPRRPLLDENEDDWIREQLPGSHCETHKHIQPRASHFTHTLHIVWYVFKDRH